MLAPNKKIAFRTHISMKVGLGHFSRLESLGSNLKSKIIWFISGDRKIIKKVCKKKFFYVGERYSEDKKVVQYLLKNNIKKVVMDLGFEKNIFSKKIYRIQNFYLDSKIKLISFDDVRQKIMSDISIIPSVSSTRLILKKTKNSKIFCGHEYNFSLNLKKKQYINNYKSKIKNILISISGTDAEDVGVKILRLLANKSFKFTIVSGKRVDFNLKKNKILKKNIKKIKTLSFISKKNMLNQIKKTDLGICGPGVIKFDFSIFQKPFVLVLTRKDLKNIQIKEFLKFKNCKTIFTQKNFLRPVEINKIFEYLKSSKNQNKNITNSKKFFNVNKLFEKQRVLLKTINN